MSGTIYGIGTGPGDPELLTIKAIKKIKEADVIAIPSDSPDDCLSYRTAKAACPEIIEKELLPLPFPMTTNQRILSLCHQKNAESVQKYLDNNKNVAFLTIGDPAIYSTYDYLHTILSAKGYNTEIISGIPSFCAAAAALNTTLCRGKHKLEIIPASYDENENDFFETSGTKVLMKSGRKYSQTVRLLRKHGRKALMVENCSMDNEKKYYSADELPDQSGYLTLIISPEDDI